MSDNIFAEIYNKILSLFGQNVKDESKNTAVNRLRLVLMQDRTNLTPEIMNRMRTELIAVLSKYVELDKEALDLNIGQEGEQMALMLSIPVIRAKDADEIEQAIKEAEEAEKAKVVENDSEDEENEEVSETNESDAEDSYEKSEESVIPEETENTDSTENIKEETEIEIKEDENAQESDFNLNESDSEETVKNTKSEKIKKDKTSEEK